MKVRPIQFGVKNGSGASGSGELSASGLFLIQLDGGRNQTLPWGPAPEVSCHPLDKGSQPFPAYTGAL